MTTYNKLVPNTVSFQGLNPLTFLERSAYVYPRKTAVVYGEKHFTYQEFHQRVVKLSAALKQVGVAKGDTRNARRSFWAIASGRDIGGTKHPSVLT